MFVYQMSKPGQRHLANGIDCEDALRVLAAGNVVMAFMADGLGSAQYAKQAAQACVDAASQVAPWLLIPHSSMVDRSAMTVVRGVFPAAYNALQRIARGDKEVLRGLQTTFMAVVYNADSHMLTWGHCGDGGIVALDIDDNLVAVTQRQKGEFVYQTSTIHDFPAWTFGTAQCKVKAFAFMTDGLYDRFCPFTGLGEQHAGVRALKDLLMLPGRTSEGRLKFWLDCLFDPMRETTQPIGSLIRSVSDDRSIVLVSSN